MQAHSMTLEFQEPNRYLQEAHYAYLGTLSMMGIMDGWADRLEVMPLRMFNPVCADLGLELFFDKNLGSPTFEEDFKNFRTPDAWYPADDGLRTVLALGSDLLEQDHEDHVLFSIRHYVLCELGALAGLLSGAVEDRIRFKLGMEENDNPPLPLQKWLVAEARSMAEFVQNVMDEAAEPEGAN